MELLAWLYGSSMFSFLKNLHIILLILHASKVMLKILQTRLQQYVNQGLPEVQLDLQKAEEEGKSENVSGRNEEEEASQLFRGTSLIATGFGRLLGLWHVVSLGMSWEPRLI